LDFWFRVGMSVLIEFALSHTPADVLRELVQNEYDARGTELVIDFGQEALAVRGNGNTIDSAGWKRLSVMLGHGLVAGTAADHIKPKVNGIGSKNFGLRSLFLLGDRVHVMSGGRRTILDRIQGALAKPLPHPDSRGRPGVTLIVPYRQADDGPLQAFDRQREAEALKAIAAELTPTLIKLAHPGSGKNLRAVVLRSARLGSELRWRQAASSDKSAPDLISRTARLVQRGPEHDGTPEAIREIEYQHVATPPAGLHRPNVPGYFRVPAGRIRIGVSARIRRGRLNLGTPGIFYYPIGASRSRTGFGFSVSAPFEMNDNRDQLTDPQNSDWNAWLIQQAAAFAIALLPQRLFSAFGPDAFLAFDPRASVSSTVPALGEEISRLLRSESCWPTQATAGRAGRPVPAQARSLAIPAIPALGDITVSELAANRLLHADIAARPDTRALAMAVGGKAFTLGSLVRLRCAGVDASELATKLDEATEASYSFTDFPDALRDLRLQQRFGAALDACSRHLTDSHKKDLRTSPTTMTAAGTLASPKTLWIVGEALADVVSADRALHPGLADSKVLVSLCRRFNFSEWAIETAGHLVEEAATAEERDALGSYIREWPTLSQKAWAAIRRCPVLQDHRGAWTAPHEMVSRSASGASLLEPALHFPVRADETNESLTPLRFRTAVRGGDLVALARMVERGKVSPPVINRAVSRLQRLLTPAVLAQLAGIKFLDTGQDRLTAPTDAYIRSDRLVALLGEDAPYASGLSPLLLRRLGCRSEPRADDIIAALAKLRHGGQGVSRPDVVYRALVAALRLERRPSGELQDQPVVWTGNSWEAPGDCLVGAENRNAFLGTVTVLSDVLRDVWVFLGVHQRPTEAHWQHLLVQVGDRYGAQQPVPRNVAEAVRRAYRRLGKPPEDLSSGTYCLLDDQRRLHTLSEATAGRFLIDDDPALASAAVTARVPVSFASFADTSDERAIQFLQAAGVRLLSSETTLAGTEYGPETPPEERLQLDSTLARLHDPNFASAVAALATAVSGPDQSRTAASLTARLTQVTRIRIVKGIQRRYRIARHEVTVAADYDVSGDQITVDQVTSAYELRRSLARAIAILADPGPLGEQVLGDAVYFLLQSRTAEQMQRELARRKIAWQPGLTAETENAEDADDEEVAALADAISQKVVREALSARPGNPSAQQMPAPSPARSSRPPLPDLSLVNPRPAPGMGAPSQRRHTASAGSGPNAWSPRSDQESEDDSVVGRRGEEIVLCIERERVSKLGLPPDRVTWIADSLPAADHDIKSVDEEGNDLWIEVKSTTGRDGHFRWPVAEFRLAVRKRRHYVLYRVYEADTTAPSWSRIPDPIGSFDAGELRLDLDRLTGDVGPLAESPD
jgi:hypothetical protein